MADLCPSVTGVAADAQVSQAADLLSDLSDALDRNSAEPYFLGSLVLIKQRESPESQVVDGQQRLTTLTILFAVLAELADGAVVGDLFRKLISEPGDMLLGSEAKPRLEVRPRDRDFFRKYVQTAGMLADLLTLPDSALANDSQVAVRDNAKLLHDSLRKWDSDRRLRLGQLLAQRTYLVVVTTPDLASAHRIFSVMNARGLDLSPADVLKSDVIGQIRDDWREDYARKWEDAEEDLGRIEFVNLLVDMRMLFSKRRAREELLKEFPRQVLSRFGPALMHSFIDDELVPLASAYCEIRDASYAPGDPGSAEINAWFRRLVQLDNGDWRAPALWALRYHHNDHKFLCQFLERLERLRTHWTNRIANLVLLGRIKNSASANFDFEKKKEKYFKGHTGVATFGLTVEVLNEPSWTPQILEQRQSRLLGKLTGAWQLG